MVTYSPLCDTSLAAYVSYCIANGGGFERSGGIGGGRCTGADGSGCVDTVDCAHCHDSCGGLPAWLRPLVLGGGFAGTGAGGLTGGRLALAGDDRPESVSGVPAGDAGGSFRGLAHRSGDDSHGTQADLSAAAVVVAEKTVDVETVRGTPAASGVRGPNFDRNQEWKRLKKEKKKRNQLVASVASEKKKKQEKKKKKGKNRAMASSDWRAGPQSQHVGYFAGLSVGVQEKLKQSRAELLVAENERKALQEKRKLERLNSPVAILEQAMKAVDFAGRAAKKACDSKVAGWATAVTTSYAETVAKTVESSEGSFESFVWSAKSGETVATAAGSNARESEYKRRVAEVHAAFNIVGTYDPASLEEELSALRSEFADVNYPPGTAERIKANMHAVEFVQRAVILDRDKVKYLEQLEREREAIELEFECTGY